MTGFEKYELCYLLYCVTVTLTIPPKSYQNKKKSNSYRHLMWCLIKSKLCKFWKACVMFYNYIIDIFFQNTKISVSNGKDSNS